MGVKDNGRFSRITWERKKIVKGENYTVEHFVNRQANRGKIRLSIYAALMRTALYLSEKNGLAIQGATFFAPLQ